jgi:hypothetical protein
VIAERVEATREVVLRDGAFQRISQNAYDVLLTNERRIVVLATAQTVQRAAILVTGPCQGLAQRGATGLSNMQECDLLLNCV